MEWDLKRLNVIAHQLDNQKSTSFYNNKLFLISFLI